MYARRAVFSGERNITSSESESESSEPESELEEDSSELESLLPAPVSMGPGITSCLFWDFTDAW